MGKNKNQDFIKAKAKVGQKKRPANETYVSVKSKRITIRQDTESLGSGPLNQATQSELNDLLVQLKHYSSSVRKDTLWKLRDMINANPQFLETSLAPIINLLTPTIIDEDVQVRQAFIKIYPSLVSSIKEDSISPFKDTISVYINHGITSINKGVKKTTIMLLDDLFKMSSSLILCTPTLLNNLITIAKGDKMNTIHLQKTISNKNTDQVQGLEDMTMRLLTSILNSLIKDLTKTIVIPQFEEENHRIMSIIPIYSIQNSSQLVAKVNNDIQSFSTSTSNTIQIVQSIVNLLSYLFSLLTEYANTIQVKDNSMLLLNKQKTNQYVFLDNNGIKHIQIYVSLVINCMKYISFYYHSKEELNNLYTASFISNCIKNIKDSFPYKLADKVRNDTQNKIDLFYINTSTLYIYMMFNKIQKTTDVNYLVDNISFLLQNDIWQYEGNAKLTTSLSYLLLIFKELLQNGNQKQISELLVLLFRCSEYFKTNNKQCNTILITFWKDLLLSNQTFSLVPSLSLFEYLLNTSLIYMNMDNKENPFILQLMDVINILIRCSSQENTTVFLTKIIDSFFVIPENEQSLFMKQTSSVQKLLLNLFFYIPDNHQELTNKFKSIDDQISSEIKQQYQSILCICSL
ncbi:hypothetical protein WA158_002334 [Blastocystis sp. Blastoise]